MVAIYSRFAVRPFGDVVRSFIYLSEWTRSDLPGAIRIEMAPLDSSAALLPVTNVTVPVRINRLVGVPYEDKVQ